LILLVYCRLPKAGDEAGMAELKTQKNDSDVEQFLDSVENATRKSDGLALLEIMREITGDDGSMWGDSLIGFGQYDYIYASGQSGSWFAVGFSPRKQNTTVYIMPGFEEYTDLLEQLGKHKLGKSCLYINKLADVDLGVLKQLIQKSFAQMAG